MGFATIVGNMLYFFPTTLSKSKWKTRPKPFSNVEDKTQKDPSVTSGCYQRIEMICFTPENWPTRKKIGSCLSFTSFFQWCHLFFRMNFRKFNKEVHIKRLKRFPEEEMVNLEIMIFRRSFFETMLACNFYISESCPARIYGFEVNTPQKSLRIYDEYKSSFRLLESTDTWCDFFLVGDMDMGCTDVARWDAFFQGM